ncbi:hypothetical protein [Micromonospora kangleipakensis]|uniref:hypothetical protein n=1 Tax=Micromonospora kangleipakensis TaxID=1077942 RepID=UPI001028B5DE|nr:hypothetical protein [Micromonospora kangleipakensis]
MTYYVLYRTDQRGEPAGLFVVDATNGHAMVWDHRHRAWTYNPGLAARFLDDHRNFDRYDEVDRQTADRLVPGMTGGVPLPDEVSIRSVFTREGPADGDRS